MKVRSVPKTSTATDAPVELSTKLSGAWLILGRCCCVIIFASSLTVWIADLPEYFSQLHLVCRTSACTVWELTPYSVAVLGRIGLTVQSYAIFSLALNLVSVCIWLSIAALIAVVEETVQPAYVMVWLRRPTPPEERPEEQRRGLLS